MSTMPSDPSDPSEQVSPVAPTEHEPVEHETAADIRAESVLLERAIGGWRGIIDSGVPTAVFVIAFMVTSQNLTSSLIAALTAGGIIVIWRLIRREPLQQVLAGFAGVAISAAVAKYTGRAENYFWPGFLQNLAYGTAFLISIIVRWPLLGVVVGYLTGDGTSWRQDPALRRTYAASSWIWVGLFYGRFAVQFPLYLAGAIGALGLLKIIMGIPLYVAAAYFTYRLLKPVWDAKRQR
ncbi:MAG: DUF3159 domain-containing protein [Actinobacteria bacterium]|uniref:Unannotated protein n=1 Tax=freshwater metagenome TaxID=449393 RepID=A0A6J7EGL7_9ZZZZ|nr:DUF3159 domain-containing protein [Actinomycetota bacterium]